MTVHDLVVVGAGQAGLATAHVAHRNGLRPVVLEASAEPGGSWPSYYDSLTLFSPARFSSLPGMPMHGDPNRYPHRDDVVEYLGAYARMLDVELRTSTRVVGVVRHREGLSVRTADGDLLHARAVISATGGFDTPYRPTLSGLAAFTGTVLHSCEYVKPESFAGQRVLVVGGGNSAVQIAVELAAVGRVSIATRSPLRWQNQRPLGRDFHWWLTRTGLDSVVLPSGWQPHPPVLDDGRYRASLATRNPDHRLLPTGSTGMMVTWNGRAEHVDTVILATGYRPTVKHLAGVAALGSTGEPLHRRGISTTVPQLGFVGLEWQRSLSSATLRGVGRDAAHVVKHLAGRRRRPYTPD